MRYVVSTFLALLACLGTPRALAAQDFEALATLQAQDLRLARISDEILSANADLCVDTMPVTGWVLHSADQYSQGIADSRFANGSLAIAAVVEGSPAANAGLLPHDAVLSVNGTEIAGLPIPAEGTLRDAAFALFAKQAPDEPMELQILRNGEFRSVSVAPRKGCLALVEILTGSGLIGRTDGRVIQISYELAALLDDDGLAVIFAHELAHVVLLHRRRLEAAGVSKGLLGEFGRNQQLNRQVEVEADRMSAHLLANAGYDPAIAPRFWNSAEGQRAGGGLLRSFIYPSPTSRGDLIEREIDQYLPLGASATWPGHLLWLRDRPF